MMRALRQILIIGIVLFAATVQAQEEEPMFVNRTDLIADNPIQRNYGVAVTDVDRDGEFELFVTGFGTDRRNGARNTVLKWNGEQFIDIADDTLADVDGMAIGVAACDIDGDGSEEIYVLNTDTFGGEKEVTDRLFAYNGTAWTDLFTLPMNQEDLNFTAGRSVACVDRMGTGRYGVFVANYGGPMRLYEVDDDGRVLDVAPAAGVDLVTGGRGLLSFPLVSDRMDIFAGNEQGANFLFRNNGDGTFTDIAEAAGVADAMENVRGMAPLDANGDGTMDVVYGNWEGPHRLFTNNGDNTFTETAPADMAAPTRIRTVIAADFDNDGVDEIFFNNIGQPNRLFRMVDGTPQEINIGDAQEPGGLGTGAAVGDFNGDGLLELLISHGESGIQPLTLYSAEPNDNNYLRVMPLTQAGAPARGAVVRLFTGGGQQMRVIDAGSGYLCQMEPVAHFGLGEVDAVERVEIQWPDGTTQTIDAPAINQTVRVDYP
ncbi:MAG: CRTAC1 family protein [Chloroflexota bacterium]